MLTLSPETEALVLAKSIAANKTPDELIFELLSNTRAASRMASRSRRVDRGALAALLARLDAMAVRDRRPAKIILDEGWEL